MARVWTRLHEHLGCPPGPLTFDMVRRASENELQETDDLDWKEGLPEPPRDGQWNELAKDVAAMANTRGGLLIFGVRDQTIEIVGIDPEKVNTQQYAQWIRNHVQPYLPDVDMFPLTDGSRSVLIVDVPASEMAPHFVYGTAKRDKDQMAAVVPHRDKDNTAWMSEHQVERAYRDRFSRISRVEEKLQRHIALITEAIAAHATSPSAWFVAVAQPQRPLPQGARSLSRDEAREVINDAVARARALSSPDGSIVNAMGANVSSNPRPGLRRWVCSTLELDAEWGAVLELHHDGTVVIAFNLSRIGTQQAQPQDNGAAVSDQLLQGRCYDLVATAQALQRKLRIESTQQLTAVIISAECTGPLTPYTSLFGQGSESFLPHARRPRHVQPVHTLLPPGSGDEEGGVCAQEIYTDLINQFGLG